MKIHIVILTFAAMLAIHAPASYASGFDCGRSVRGNSGGIVRAGDSAGRALKALGRPSSIKQLVNGLGVPSGERWYYYTSSKTIQITVKNGSVSRVCQQNN